MRNPGKVNAGNTVVSVFENNGLFYGALLGALCGVLIAGPHFTDWSIEKIVAAIAVSSVVVGVTGHLAVWMAYAAISAGPLDDNEGQDDSLSDKAHAVDD